MPLVVPAKIRIPVHDALPRERLEARLGEAWRHRLTLVLAPAGSGKTTLVARFAAGAAVPVAWYRAETWDADEASFVRHLEAALGGAIPGLQDGWQTIEDAAKALESRPADAALLVIDDAYALEGTPAEAAFGRFVDYAPPWLAIVVASRVPPSINLTRLRVSGDLLELGQDDLRFRSWEVEQLFRDVYHDPVPPADLAALARRMEGWAAGLQLFHLATRGRPTEERRRLMAAAEARGRLLREYLAENVLVGLRDELRRFLLDTCVLGRLSGPLCDRLRGTPGSAALLDELARHSVFTVPVEDEDDVYRYHEVLRSHLARSLVAEVGEVETRRRYARGAELLEDAGDLPEALTAWCRAEDWAAVERLLDRGGERLANGATAWLEALPPALVRHDPWLALATARRARAEGHWTAALDWYARAESALGATQAAVDCRRERMVLAAWLEGGAIPMGHWSGLLRAGLAREPLTAARDASRLEEAVRPLVRGLLLLVAGDVRPAGRALAGAADDARLEPPMRAAASLGAAIAGLLGGDPRALAAVTRSVELAEQAGTSWLAALGRDVAQALVGVDPVIDGFGGDGDAGSRPDAGDDRPTGDGGWRAALGTLAAAWVGLVVRGDAQGLEATSTLDRLADLDRAGMEFRRLGAGVLEAWARGLGSLADADAGLPEAREQALNIEALGRLTGVPGVRLLAYRALGVADSQRGSDFTLLAEATEAEIGLAVPARAVEPVDDERHPSNEDTQAGAPGRSEGSSHQPTVDVALMGGLRISVAGTSVGYDAVKPRARALLRLLALHAPAPVHREVIQEALWPDADPSTGARSLQVAISSLRGLLGSTTHGDVSRLIERQDDTYRLAVAEEAVDLRRFERAVADARSLIVMGVPAMTELRHALDLYAGDVLPEDGPADWVVARRDRARFEAVEMAIGLAEAALAAGHPHAAIQACQRGLGLDRFHDPLWRLLIAAREQAGDAGAASRDRREYAAVLAGLGVPQGEEAPTSSIRA